MKKSSLQTSFTLASVILIISFAITSCLNDDNPIKYPNGTVPDTAVFALTDINSVYDDYNLDLHQLYSSFALIFSSNRNSSGGQFDIVQAGIQFGWDQTIGIFGYTAGMISDAFYNALLSAANTEGDDFGPYRFFSTLDGYEYTLLSSENETEGLDFYYLKNLPSQTTVNPLIHGPYPATLLNTGSDEAYISFDLNQDTAYFSSNRGGNFDIYTIQRPSGSTISDWLSGTFTVSILVDSVNSIYEDKFPFLHRDILVFASNRPGGMGGYDLYYAIFRNGKWSTPENLGPSINTASDECRPVLGFLPGYTNYLLMFSSDRTAGNGAYYKNFTGITNETD